MNRSPLAALALVAAFFLAPRAGADCTLGKVAELPVTMSGAQPTVAATINGARALFVAESGAFYSLITPAGAARFGLELAPAPFGLRVGGVGGEMDVSVATVKAFGLAGATLPNVEFLVGGAEPGAGADGVIGQNILGVRDVEYDLANGAIRLMRAAGGCGNKALAYWVQPGHAYSVMDIGQTSPLFSQTTGVALVNGRRVRVRFDTGAAVSFLTPGAARRAGVDLKGPGVVSGGPAAGLGRRLIESSIAPVASFKIGDEEVRNTRLRIGEAGLGDSEMLIGADFFLSHRVLIATSQHKLYFTYNGGPVFDLAAKPVVQAGAGAKPEEVAASPADAEGFSRRGAAFAARRDFDRAIADLDRASELAPKEPKYVYQRALVHREINQDSLAMADIDRALALAPDDVPALVFRAELHLAGRDKSSARPDLQAADRLAAKEADIRLRIAQAYARADLFAAAVAQYGLWIQAHPQDGQLAAALNGRCWTRALWGQELDKALADCDAALRMTPKAAGVLDSRGLVRLRQGDLDRAIADYDAALRLAPRIAWSLYGRGVAKSRKGLSAEGKADIAAATALEPRLPEEAKARGIGP